MSQQENSPESTIAGILREFGELTGDIPSDKDIHTDLGVKSANFISILLALEDKFHITIEDTEFIKARTLDSLALLVEQSRSQI